VGTTEVCFGELWFSGALPPLSMILLYPRYNLPLPARHNCSIVKHLNSQNNLHIYERLESKVYNTKLWIGSEKEKKQNT